MLTLPLAEMSYRSFGRRVGVGAALSFVLVSVAAGAAQTQTKAEVERVYSGLGQAKNFGEVSVAPDGLSFAYVEQTETGRRIALAPMSDPTKITRVTAAKKDERGCSESEIAWAPDSHRFAFMGNCPGGGQDNVFLAKISGDVAGGKAKVEVEKLTDAKGEVDSLSFSPDGTKIGFLYVENATRSAGALAAMKPWAGVIGEDGVEIQRVAVVDAAAHAVKPVQVTSAKLHVYGFDWAPDAKSIAYVAAEPPGENNWWVAKLYTQDLSVDYNTGPKAIFAPAEDRGPMHGLQIAVPRWSPDGKQIAFVGGLMSDEGSNGGDVWVIPATGGEPRNLTPGRKTSAAWIEWADDNSIFVSEQAGGRVQLAKAYIMLNGHAEEPIFSIEASVGDGRSKMSLSPTKDHSTWVFHASSFDHPTEIFAVKAGGATVTSFDGLTKLTHANDGLTPVWGKAESLEWKNDGFDVQGWLLQPAHYDPAKRYPMVVLVHGGPASAAQSGWVGTVGLSATAFSAMGYFVLEANPRGSFGQGEKFAEANRKDFGYGDLRDIVAGVDTVLKKYPAVDGDRVGLTGWSYGGFMTMFAVTQTHRFKAAVAGAGIANWLSYYGENSIDQWMTPYFGASVYDDPKAYAKSSAIDFIHKVKTPVLVVVGDRDGECPAPQSFEYWHALKAENVPTRLVVYPNEGHGFVSSEHRVDVLVRALDWFAQYMPAEPAATKTGF